MNVFKMETVDEVSEDPASGSSRELVKMQVLIQEIWVGPGICI